MFQSLLLAIDGSDMSLHAAQVALELAALFHARLDLLSVEEAAPRYVATNEENAQAHAAALAYYQRLHEPIRRRAERKGIPVQSVIMRGHEGHTTITYAREQQCDLLIAGALGHSGVWETALGSTADKLVNHAPCSVLVVRENRQNKRIKRILVALDGSPLSWQAFQMSLHLAPLLGATLHAVSVVEGPRVPSPERIPPVPPSPSGGLRWDWSTYLGQMQAQAIAQAGLADIPLETSIYEGHASSVLVHTARDASSDLILLGATGHEHPWSLTSGGTARKVANEAPCAVLLFRPPAAQQCVRDVMSRALTTVAPDASLSSVISLLIEQEVRLVIVTDEQRPGASGTAERQRGHILGVITLGSLLAQDQAYRRLDLRQAANADRLLPYLRQFFRAKKTAHEVMLKQPLVVRDEIAVEPAVRWILAHHLTRVPVVNAQEELVGLLDQEELLRYYTGSPRTSEPLPAHTTPQAAAPQTVGDLPMTTIPCVALETPLVEVQQAVQTTPLRRVIVINHEGLAVGVIAEREILASQGFLTRRNPLLALAGRFSLIFPEEVLHWRTAPGPVTAQHLMKPRLFSASPSTPLSEAVRLMLAHQIKRLVVVDTEGRPLGLVDRQQLLRALLGDGP